MASKALKATIEKFVDAARNGRTRFVKDCIAAGVPVNEPASGKTTALMAAADNGRAEIVKLLLDHGADLKQAGSGGWTSLMLAARRGHLDVVKALIEAGADLNAATRSGDTALSAALSGQKKRVIDLLQKSGAAVSSNALHEAAHQYVQERALATRDYTPAKRKTAAKKAEALRPRLEKIVAAGAAGGDYALWEAVKYRQRDTVRLLLKANASPDAAPHSTSALATACANKDLGTVQILLKAGANPDTSEFRPPLLVAIEKNSPDIVAELIHHGANPDLRPNNGPTPLLLATTENKIALMKALLDAGANPNAVGRVEIAPAPKPTVKRHRIGGGRFVATTTHFPDTPEAVNIPPLIVASRRNLRQAAELLLDRDADSETKDPLGMTALAWARKLGHTEIEKLLIARGADRNVDVEGSLENALLAACAKGDLARVKELLRGGADANTHIDSAEDRRTALGEATRSGSAEIIGALLKAGAKVDKPTGKFFGPRGVTPLMLAAQAGHPDAVAALLEAGANVKAIDSEIFSGGGTTPLHYAARGGNRRVVQLLIAAGADVSARDRFKSTPMDYAASAGHAAVIDELLKYTTIRTVSGVSKVLRSAVESGSLAAVERILAANPNAHGNDPDFATLMAAQTPLPIIRALRKAKMRFDQKDSADHTPLQLARRYKRLDLVKFLAANAK